MFSLLTGLSVANGGYNYETGGPLAARCSPTLMTNTSSTPTPTGSSSSGGGLYAKVNKKAVVGSNPAFVNSRIPGKRESPDEGIQDDVSTDV